MIVFVCLESIIGRLRYKHMLILPFHPSPASQGGGYFRTELCRAEQTVYDNCVLEHLGQERVHYGYFGKIRLHETTRPKPQEIPIKHAPLPDEVPETFDPEEIQAVRGFWEGELWSKKV